MQTQNKYDQNCNNSPRYSTLYLLFLDIVGGSVEGLGIAVLETNLFSI